MLSVLRGFFFYNVKVEAVFEKGNACDSGNGDHGIRVRVKTSE